jgi:hypothetical protein
VLVPVVVLFQAVGHLHYLLVGGVAVAALVVETVLVFEVVGLGPDAAVFEAGVAVLALRHDSLDVTVLVVGRYFEGIYSQRWVLPGIVLHHGKQDAYVADLLVLAALLGKEEDAHMIIGYDLRSV